MDPRTIDPELAEAARGDIPAKFVRIVGVVVRGDQAMVAQLTNEAPTYEIETVHCHRDQDGWEAGSSGNGNLQFLPTGAGVGSIVIWDLAPEWAVAAQFSYGEDERTVAVENGIALATFDDVPVTDWPSRWWQQLTGPLWIDGRGETRPG